MLVKFETESSASVTLFGNIALSLLNMMGYSTTVPGALYVDDVPEALRSLSEAINNQPASEADSEDSEEELDEIPVDLRHRALPLIELLTAAVESKYRVSWEETS
jgi:hypothetical protein